ncbi:class I SAM-dependent methyltransferase [Pseudoduganella namucuonensis]|uniref:Methyltransferase domain-containing protein n=1 Tax=Pseudoduganella namucuonensis TaxID=1035707 RepID=A0A1I7LW06_9BURK|nr:class I SAM-dependent methyltransferase [Pseudoduganella namucuonensis]SFV13865.1 Methyltransferase domain-containing protein [Pseudoduganella namucuonensis]
MSWNNGYVSDIEYPAGFFPEQGPAWLNFTCLLNGYQPAETGEPFTYCELGCGTGMTANVLAASNPHGRFYACDFMPAHIAEGRELAGGAGLDNLTLLENSFDDLARGAIDLPMFDFVTMYGVYGWVNEENRQLIVNFLARYLKPGGVVYLNYNAMPGWAAVHPLQNLIRNVADASVGTRAQRCEQARRVVDQLHGLRAKYFTDNDSGEMRLRLDSVRLDDVGYVAHEYMNDGWQPLYHADVARQLAGAGLDFIGSASHYRSFPGLYLAPEQQELLRQSPPAMRETVADYLSNTSFREDVYVRGAARLSPEQQAAWLGRMGLALTVPRGLVKHNIKLVTGELFEKAGLIPPVLDALAQAPRTLAELMALPAFRQETAAMLYQVAALLIGSRQACACHVRQGDGGGDAAAGRLNRAMAAAPQGHSANRVLASPVLGNGVVTSTIAQFVHRVLCEMDGGAANADAVAERVWDVMEAEGHGPRDAEGTEKIHRILEKLVPLWRQLRIL